MLRQAEDENDPISSSSSTLPDCVPEVHESTFCPPHTQRGEGQPSPKLKASIGAGTVRSGTTMNIVTLMVSLFLFFLSLPTLLRITEFTNSKAEEIVNKVRCTGKNGKVYYKVNAHTSYTFYYTHTHMHTPC